MSNNNFKFVMSNKCLQNYKGKYILETCNNNYITQQFNTTDGNYYSNISSKNTGDLNFSYTSTGNILNIKTNACLSYDNTSGNFNFSNTNCANFQKQLYSTASSPSMPQQMTMTSSPSMSQQMTMTSSPSMPQQMMMTNSPSMPQQMMMNSVVNTPIPAMTISSTPAPIK